MNNQKWADLKPEAESHLGKMAGEDEDGKQTSIGRIGNKPQLTVSFRKQDGSGYAFSYSHIYRIGFQGQSTLAVEFSDHTVTVEGRNLGKLLRYLCDHKASVVWETDREKFAADGAEVVENITVAVRK